MNLSTFAEQPIVMDELVEVTWIGDILVGRNASGNLLNIAKRYREPVKIEVQPEGPTRSKPGRKAGRKRGPGRPPGSRNQPQAAQPAQSQPEATLQ